MQKHTVLIVGAGFGGLRTALSLHHYLLKTRLRERVAITLVDRDPYEIYTPLLYKYAADAHFPESVVALPLNPILEGTDISFLEGSVQAIDLEKSAVILADGTTVRADTIVLAAGTETNYFGIPGLAEHSLPLKNFTDAKRLRTLLDTLPEHAHIVIGGGGPTGAELAAEIRLARRHNVSIIEGSPQILPGFPQRFQNLTVERLQKIGVALKTGEMITEVREKSLRTDKGTEVPFDVLIWTGGVQVPEWIARLPLKSQTKGHIEVSREMCCAPKTLDLHLGGTMYALGDTTCVLDAEGKPLPGTARAAIQEAKIIAYNIFATIYAKERNKAIPELAYHPMRYPYVLPIGNDAILMIGSMIIPGFLARWFKEAIALNYLASIMSFGKAFRIWKSIR